MYILGERNRFLWPCAEDLPSRDLDCVNLIQLLNVCVVSIKHKCKHIQRIEIRESGEEK